MNGSLNFDSRIECWHALKIGANVAENCCSHFFRGCYNFSVTYSCMEMNINLNKNYKP